MAVNAHAPAPAGHHDHAHHAAHLAYRLLVGFLFLVLFAALAAMLGFPALMPLLH